jgi:DNA-binding beta-propeller fold protein YncE
MTSARTYLRAGLLAVAALGAAAAGCGGSSSNTPTYAVGGTIVGLTSSGLVLQNGMETVRVSVNANSFQFPTRLEGGTAYDVTVTQQPAGLTCGVHNGSGSAGSGSSNSVSVYCVSGQQFVYGGGNLFSLDAVTGALSFSAQTLNCCRVAIADPLGHFLFAVDSVSLGIDTFAIDPTNGFLTPQTQISPPPAPGGFTSLVIDPSGSYLYATVALQASVYAYAIGANAALTPLTKSPFAAGSFPVALAVDPQSSYLYAANNQDGTISAYTIGAGGTLAPIAGSPFRAVATNAGLDSLVTPPAGGFLYAHAGVGTGTGVYVFAINAQTGALSKPGSPFLSPQVGTSSLAMAPSGAFIYLANQLSNQMSVARVNPQSGALTAVPGSPFVGGGITGQITPDASGQFVYTAGNTSVSGFAFNSTTGALTVLPTSPYISGQAGYVLVVRPSP